MDVIRILEIKNIKKNRVPNCTLESNKTKSEMYDDMYEDDITAVVEIEAQDYIKGEYILDMVYAGHKNMQFRLSNCQVSDINSDDYIKMLLGVERLDSTKRYKRIFTNKYYIRGNMIE